MNEKRGRLIFMVLGFNNSIGNTSNFLIVVPWTQVLTSKCSSMLDCLYKIVKYLVDTVEVSFVSEKKNPKIWKEWEEIHRLQWMSKERVSVEELLHFGQNHVFPSPGAPNSFSLNKSKFINPFTHWEWLSP